MARDADDAVLADLDRDSPKGSGVVGDGDAAGFGLGVENAEHAGDAAVDGSGLAQVYAGGDAVDVLAEVYADDAGFGVDFDVGLEGDAFWEGGERVEGGLAVDLTGWELADLGVGHALGVVEPLLLEALDGLEAVFLTEFLDALLADAAGGEHGEIVAVPDLGDADAFLAHADDVTDIGVVLLDLDAGEDEGAFGVDVDGFGCVGGGDGVAAVGLVGLNAGGEDMLAFEEDGDQDGVVGWVGVAEVGVVVEEGVALFEVGVVVGHGLAEEARTVDVAWDAFRGGEELVADV